ncbi:hypothetical protein MIDIC_70063 [Alphaproteobacteria bacterium]
MLYEPTGGYEHKFKQFLKSNQLAFNTVHPNKVRSYAKAKGCLAKTDRVDCKLLYDYAATFALSAKVEYQHSLIQRRE